jgi:Protein of unknown function (DUF2778)
MWEFSNKTGILRHLPSENSGILIAVGYSGAGKGKNNPAMQSVHNVGPIPCGTYHIALTPFDSSKHGPLCLRLEPAATNEMFGRSEFLIHGDSREHPGCASEGCVIMPHYARQRILDSADPVLRVVSDGEEEETASNKKA